MTDRGGLPRFITVGIRNDTIPRGTDWRDKSLAPATRHPPSSAVGRRAGVRNLLPAGVPAEVRLRDSARCGRAAYGSAAVRRPAPGHYALALRHPDVHLALRRDGRTEGLHRGGPHLGQRPAGGAAVASPRILVELASPPVGDPPRLRLGVWRPSRRAPAAPIPLRVAPQRQRIAAGRGAAAQPGAADRRRPQRDDGRARDSEQPGVGPGCPRLHRRRPQQEGHGHSRRPGTRRHAGSGPAGRQAPGGSRRRDHREALAITVQAHPGRLRGHSGQIADFAVDVADSRRAAHREPHP